MIYLDSISSLVRDKKSNSVKTKQLKYLTLCNKINMCQINSLKVQSIIRYYDYVSQQIFTFINLIQSLQYFMQNKKKICVLGSANLDSFVYVKHIPVPGQTIQAQKYMTANGGKGANQAAAAGKLSGSCVFSGQVGQDDEMRSLKNQLTECNVELNWKIMGKQTTTGKAFIYVDETGQNSIVIVGGANTFYPDKTILSQQYKSSIDKCDYLLLQKQIPVEINQLAAKYAKQKNKITVLDCGGRDQDITQGLLANLDFISPNQTQLLRIDPNIDTNNIVEEIRNKLIAKYKNLKVLLKLGSNGSMIITDKICVSADVATKRNQKLKQDYKIIDTVGAGDCFTAAFSVKHTQLDWSQQQNEEQNYKKALNFGNNSAFLCITKKGAMPSMPSRTQVEEFMKNYNLQ